MAPQSLPTTFECLSRAEACRDFGTNSHSWRVGGMVRHVGLALGVSPEDVRRFAQATVLHDIGKLAVPIDLLQKSTPLSPEEFALIRTHTQIGHGILHVPGDAMMILAAEIALHHHERYDGTGYPHGISGEAIPLPAQIAAICDTYDALRQDRPYRRGLAHDDAMGVITLGDGRTKPEHFAPRVLSAFQSVSDEVRRVFNERFWAADEISRLAPDMLLASAPQTAIAAEGSRFSASSRVVQQSGISHSAVRGKAATAVGGSRRR
jgi:putative two-component system response regulator